MHDRVGPLIDRRSAATIRSAPSELMDPGFVLDLVVDPVVASMP